MALYEEMRLKRSAQVVRVYSIQDNMALIFNPETYKKQNNGWEKIKISSLVPLDYPVNAEEYIGKTQKNKAKQRMRLTSAIWLTTDGKEWAHENYEEAINHEIELMKSEKGE